MGNPARPIVPDDGPILQLTDGHLIYSLDDAYIHMAIAKNFSQHGVWGVAFDQFSSSTSSILWTSLLAAAYFIFGVNEIAPLVMNLLSAFALIGVVYHITVRFFSRPFVRLGFILLVIELLPVTYLIFTGMEHLLHVTLCLVLVDVTARAFQGTVHLPKTLLILAPLAVLARYESLFLIAAICVLYAAKKRLRDAVALGLAASLPILIYGLVSVSQGWFLLPNSLLLKSTVINTAWNVQRLLLMLFERVLKLILVRHLALLFGVCLLLVWAVRRQPLSMRIWPYLFLVTCTFHVLFAEFSATNLTVFRYEGYLIALGLLAVGACAGTMQFSTRVFTLRNALPAALWATCILCGASLSVRAFTAVSLTPTATSNIYQQQYQMGLFVRQYFNSQAVAVNDVGAVSFLADVHTVDLWGLANLEVARHKLTGTYTTEVIRTIAEKEKVQIAMVFDTWFDEDPILPTEWAKIGKWTIQNNVVCGEDTVTFYTLGEKINKNRSKAFEDFTSGLYGSAGNSIGY
ncbi:MAG TPA: hypothetical protein VHO48_13565 [Anaerolineaceae bacterium]|nr:hypothetical protein [Anaerolineaceae bacterium]